MGESDDCKLPAEVKHIHEHTLLPGEWALKKAFGPILDEFGDDLKRIYAAGRDRILGAAYSKLDDPNDGKQANIRVMRDVLWNGAFTDDEVCSEYFGGILASSRSKDGKDDSSIQFVDVIKSLSSKQLRLHYLIYNALNKILVFTKSKINVGLSTDVEKHAIWLASLELQNTHGINIDTDLNVLFRQGLFSEFRTDAIVQGSSGLPYCMIKPKVFGIILYAVAHNRLDEWRSFNAIDYGNFESIPSLKVFARSLDELKQMGRFPSPTAPDDDSSGT